MELKTHFTTPSTRRTLEVTVAVLVTLYGTLLIASFFMDGILPANTWIQAVMNLLLIGFILYNVKLTFSAGLDFRSDGISYKNPDQRERVFVPKSEIQDITIQGLVLTIHTASTNHQVNLGTMKFAEVEQARKVVSDYLDGLKSA